ncbi:flippase-like domain-containing protein [Candidatus Parcubacteria bacterium]|nr:flippase-like domain-containing protein [Candidatus Parcubacteria bacterium]
MAEKLGGKWKKIITIITLLALGVLIYVSRQQIGETLSNLGRVQASFLVLILLWKFLVFHGYTKMYIDMFKILGKKIEYWTMYKITLELNFVNNVFPSGGVTGFSYFSLKMHEFGISAGRSTLVQAMRFINTFVSFQIFIFFGLFVLAAAGKAGNLTILVASSLTTLLVVGTVLLAYIISSRERISGFFTFLTKLVNRLIHFVRPASPETINIAAARKMFYELHDNYLEIKKDLKKLKKPILYISLANFGEIAALYSVFLAFGEAVNPGAVIIAYAIANFAGLISVLPGGVGIYEALMVAVLATGGVSPAVSIPAVIMYRMLTMSLQLPIGYYFYHKTINSAGGIGKNMGDLGKT